MSTRQNNGKTLCPPPMMLSRHGRGAIRQAWSALMASGAGLAFEEIRLSWIETPSFAWDGKPQTGAAPAPQPHGYLYGGNLLKWVDEYAWITSLRDSPGRRFVTVDTNRVAFHRSVRKGAILRFDIRQCRKGNTLVQYKTMSFRKTPSMATKSASSTPPSPTPVSTTRGASWRFDTAGE